MVFGENDAQLGYTPYQVQQCLASMAMHVHVALFQAQQR
jgi:hypothetical protein